jgi:hypothetical protein
MAIALIANWEPLERLLAPDLCAEFMWMFREGGIEHYKHICDPAIPPARSTRTLFGFDSQWAEGGAF